MRYILLFTCIPVFPVDFPKLQEYDIYQGGNRNIMKLKKIWSVIKGILSLCFYLSENGFGRSATIC